MFCEVDALLNRDYKKCANWCWLEQDPRNATSAVKLSHCAVSMAINIQQPIIQRPATPAILEAILQPWRRHSLRAVSGAAFKIWQLRH